MIPSNSWSAVAALGGLVNRQRGRVDFFQILRLVDEALHRLGGHVAGLVHQKARHLGVQSPAGIAHGLAQLHIRGEHHVGPHVIPLVHLLQKPGLYAPPVGLLHLIVEASVHVQLVPRDLIDQHARPLRLQAVESDPARLSLVLLRQAGPLRIALRQFAQSVLFLLCQLHFTCLLSLIDRLFDRPAALPRSHTGICAGIR